MSTTEESTGASRPTRVRSSRPCRWRVDHRCATTEKPWSSSSTAVSQSKKSQASSASSRAWRTAVAHSCGGTSTVTRSCPGPPPERLTCACSGRPSSASRRVPISSGVMRPIIGTAPRCVPPRVPRAGRTRRPESTATGPGAVACSPRQPATTGGGGMPAPSDATERSQRPSAAVGSPLGAPASFEELYAAHFTDLAVQLYAYFGDQLEAQDVVQEAFCRALARWSTISRYDDPVAWVRRVAWNLAVSQWRRTRAALAALARLHRQPGRRVDGPGPDRVALVAALATLPARQRQVVV